MYIAIIKKREKTDYFIRESVAMDGLWTFRDLFHLTPHPSDFIIYGGGNSFYFDERIEDTIAESGAALDGDILEDLFWPWIRPDIRQAIDTFRGRASGQKKRLTRQEKDRMAESVHSFDKRRTHFLRFSNMDQGPVGNMPSTLFKDLAHKSRDEIEQHFLQQEFSLKVHELKSYVYTVFDLQRFFRGFLAKEMPQALDHDKVERFFTKEICRLNKDLFDKTTHLHYYMIRYAVMFFDHPYANSPVLDNFARDFMFRHRSFTPRPQKSTSTRKALKTFGITRNNLRKMSRKDLTRCYRKLARKVHPDTGGSHEKFVALNHAYECLMAKINPANS